MRLKFHIVPTIKSFCKSLACAEVDDEIKEKNGVGDTVEDHPAGAQVVVEESDGDRQNYQVDEQRQHHEQVPVKPTHRENTLR